MDRRFLVPKEIEREWMDPRAAHLHWMNRVWCNYHVVKALVSTAKGPPTGWVGLEDLIDKQQEVAVDWVKKRTPGAIEVDWGPTEKTLEFSFDGIIDRHDGLTVEKGIIRRLPFRVADGRFYLFVGEDDVQPSVPALKAQGLYVGWPWK
jgi:hypothetical protein